MKKVTDINPNLIISLIENKLLKKNIKEALALIVDFREKFPSNKKIDFFLEKQKKNLNKKHLFSKNYLLKIYKSSSKFEAVQKLINISRKDKINSLLYSLISNLYGGRLKDEIRPNENGIRYNKILFLFKKVKLFCENILILIFLF